MDLRTLGVLVGAILSTVRGAFFVRCRSTSGTSQSDYDFEPPEFLHGPIVPFPGPSYLSKSLLRCSIQICVIPFRLHLFFVSGWFDAGSPASTIYLREGPGYQIHLGFRPHPSGSTSRARIPQNECPWLARLRAGFFLNSRDNLPAPTGSSAQDRQPMIVSPMIVEGGVRISSQTPARRQSAGRDCFRAPRRTLEDTGFRCAAESWPILRPDLMGPRLFESAPQLREAIHALLICDQFSEIPSGKLHLFCQALLPA